MNHPMVVGHIGDGIIGVPVFYLFQFPPLDVPFIFELFSMAVGRILDGLFGVLCLLSLSVSSPMFACHF